MAQGDIRWHVFAAETQVTKTGGKAALLSFKTEQENLG